MKPLGRYRCTCNRDKIHVLRVLVEIHFFCDGRKPLSGNNARAIENKELTPILSKARYFLLNGRDCLVNHQEVTHGNRVQVLGVPTTATAEEIKARYRSLILTAHPDKSKSEVCSVYS